MRGNISEFQLTASQGGWLRSKPTWTKSLYFNSQPHKEADLSLLNCLNRSNISTHSLTRRLTGCPGDQGEVIRISTHSLTRRLTLNMYERIARRSISTHSLTRRLTLFECDEVFYLVDFNSQPHKEADYMVGLLVFIKLIFQLTASQGGWRWINLKFLEVTTFQLTASQGGWP